MARPRTEAPEARRRRILDAARAVMIREGYGDFSMQEVADEAGIAAGTLYLYFRDKDDIFCGVFTDLLDRVDERLRKVSAGQRGLAALRSIVRDMLAFVDEYQEFLFRFTGEEHGLGSTAAARRLRERYHAHLEFLGGRLKDCIREGTLRRHPPALGALHVSYLIRMFMIEKILAQSKEPLKNKTGALLDLLLNGLGK